jgi:inorganic triphosphatase YgiF
MFKQHQCRKALDRVLWKARLRWKRNEELARDKAARALQKAWKQKQARRGMLDLMHKLITKQVDPNTGQEYYYNEQTGEAMWEKPAFMAKLENQTKKKYFYGGGSFDKHERGY